MIHCVDDTIAAIASAPGGGVRGVIRLSGPETVRCLEQCFRATAGDDLTRVKRATLIPGTVRVADPIGSLACDMYLWPNERSYTRQISAELHTVGSPPLLDGILQELCNCGARLAQPGEFTLRAFLAGRLDLTQAEAVLGVVDAEDARSLNVALRQLAGGLAAPLDQLRSDLLDVLAHIEAGLDFVEEDLDFIEAGQIADRLAAARTEIEQLLRQIVSRGQVTHEPTVVLRGWPNVGKSSLLNALTGSRAAIVSGRPGTTRDYVTVHFRWQDASGVLVDTPGVEEVDSLNQLSSVAQQMAVEQASHADLALLCLDATRPLNAWERQQLAERSDAGRIIVWTKTDATEKKSEQVPVGIRTSSRCGEGISQLRSLIGERLAVVKGGACTVVASTAQRCRDSLQSAAAGLQQSEQLAVHGLGDELIAVELRHALDCLGMVVGAVYTDDILDRIFSRFCIGK